MSVFAKYSTFSHALYSIGFLRSQRQLSLFHFWLELSFLPVNLHLHSHDMFFFKYFWLIYSCHHIKNAQIQIFCLLHTQASLDRSLRVFQLPKYLHKINCKCIVTWFFNAFVRMKIDKSNLSHTLLIIQTHTFIIPTH